MIVGCDSNLAKCLLIFVIIFTGLLFNLNETAIAGSNILLFYIAYDSRYATISKPIFMTSELCPDCRLLSTKQ